MMETHLQSLIKRVKSVLASGVSPTLVSSTTTLLPNNYF